MAEEETFQTGGKNVDEYEIEEGENSPIEQVALTVPTTDDPTMPVYTFRMWFLGLLSCGVLAFINQFFYYRTEPLVISATTAQLIALPLGRFMAAILPSGTWMNPGPFNIKEHVLITIFANAGSAFGNGNAYAVDIVTIARAFYHRPFGFIPAMITIVCTQILGYSFAGVMKRFTVEPAHMWWPSNLVSVSLFRALHEEDNKDEGMSRFTFFCICSVGMFFYYFVPGYLFNMLTCMSWICWIWPNSVTAQQIGSGFSGLGIGAFALDWATITAYLGSPIATPWFAICNIMIGFFIIMYILTPFFYWGDVYHAKNFPIFASNLFLANGTPYDVQAILGPSGIELDQALYESYGNIHLTAFFAVTYGVGFASLACIVTHVWLWYGPEILERVQLSMVAKPDIHAKLMMKYPDIPDWWFYATGVVGFAVSLVGILVYKSTLQMPWWALIFATFLALFFTLPIGVIAATTNQVPGLNIITEFIMGFLTPGKPISVVTFKVYGYISMTQAVSFLSDFKLGVYMKIPPRAMFLVQLIGTVLAAMVNLGYAWYQLTSIKNICDVALLPPTSPWTCPISRVFYNASIIWGLIGPERVFGSKGEYQEMNWFWLIGFVAPFPFWIAYKVFPDQQWLRLVNMPILIGATGIMPPASVINFTMWGLVGWFFEYYIFHYHKRWWSKFNYVLAAGFDTGLAFSSVVIFFALQNNNYNVNWWGNTVDHCNVATCPTSHIGSLAVGAPCPVFA